MANAWIQGKLTVMANPQTVTVTASKGTVLGPGAMRSLAEYLVREADRIDPQQPKQQVLLPRPPLRSSDG